MYFQYQSKFGGFKCVINKDIQNGHTSRKRILQSFDNRYIMFCCSPEMFINKIGFFLNREKMNISGSFIINELHTVDLKQLPALKYCAFNYLVQVPLLDLIHVASKLWLMISLQHICKIRQDSHQYGRTTNGSLNFSVCIFFLNFS